MPIESSHGKARPTLPRSSDLQAVPTVSDAERQRAGSRDAHGRFAPGNVIGRGRGWKRAIARVLGRHIEDPVAIAVAADAWKDYCATLRQLPSDGPMVRGLVALKARHLALAAYFHGLGAERGLSTEEGMAALEMASKHGQRAERLAVTALDVATKLAKEPRGGPNDDPLVVEVKTT